MYLKLNPKPNLNTAYRALAPTDIVTGTNVGFTRASNSDQYLFMIVRIAQLFPSASPQIVVPGIEPIDVATSNARSKSLVRASPFSIRCIN